jgi:hypothetical protein
MSDAALRRITLVRLASAVAVTYDELWRQGKPPVEALREARLTLCHQPELVGKLAAARGTPDFDKLVQRPEPGPAPHGSPAPRHAPVRQWAAFVLSGGGR